MLREGQKLYSILHNKCPRCHRGKFWPHNPYYNLLFNGGRLYKSCPHCGLKYYREVGFWYGAMYVSYALGIAIFMAGWGITALTLPADINVWWQIGIISFIIVALTPANYALSRLIWINFFVAYNPDKKETILTTPPEMSELT
jgi:hypothetical protein